MDSIAQHRIDRQHVVHETIDGEAILVHLESGSYYSLDGPGADIWSLIEAGCSAKQIVERLGERYDAPAGEISKAVEELANQLIEEHLLVPGNGAAPAPAVPAFSANGAGKAPFEAPVLRKYTDMQELLVLDPIHEVDETGWPNKSPI